MALKKTKQAPKAEKNPEPKSEPKADSLEPQGKSIDERMADLLKDHQAMGAR